VTVFLERRQEVFERLLELVPLAAALVERRVDRDAIEPGGQRRPALEAAGLAEERVENVLDDLFGVGRRAADPAGHAIHAAREAVHQGLQRPGIPGPQPLEQVHVARLADVHACTLSCSATNGEQ